MCIYTLYFIPISCCLCFLLQEFIHRGMKPKTKKQLIDGIEKFWGTVSIGKCRKYIGHLTKVLPKKWRCHWLLNCFLKTIFWFLI